MKKIPVLLILIFMLTGCSTNSAEDFAIQINAQYTYSWNDNEITNELYIEKDDERFVWICDGIENKNDSFYFIFSYDDIYLENSDEFTYSTSENFDVKFKIIDDQSIEKYEFYGSITIYISYASASKETKDIINNNSYDIEIDNVKWFANPELFC